MTLGVPHPADAERVEHGEAPVDSVDAVAHHDAATHKDAHTAVSDDDHGQAEPRLGPIDWAAWGYAGLGVLAGLIVAALFLVAIVRPGAS